MTCKRYYFMSHYIRNKRSTYYATFYLRISVWAWNEMNRNFKRTIIRIHIYNIFIFTYAYETFSYKGLKDLYIEQNFNWLLFLWRKSSNIWSAIGIWSGKIARLTMLYITNIINKVIHIYIQLFNLGTKYNNEIIH